MSFTKIPTAVFWRYIKIHLLILLLRSLHITWAVITRPWKKRDFSSIFFAFQKIRFIVAEKNISWFHHPYHFIGVQLDLLGFVGEKARIVTFQNSQIYMIKCYSVLLWVRWYSDQLLLVYVEAKKSEKTDLIYTRLPLLG